MLIEVVNIFWFSTFGFRCGSLIFDVVLMFGTEVAEDEMISLIKNAIMDGKLEGLSVNASSITGITPVEQTSTAATTSTTTKPEGLFVVVTDNGTINHRVGYSFASCCFNLESLSVLSFQTLRKRKKNNLNLKTTDRTKTLQ